MTQELTAKAGFELQGRLQPGAPVRAPWGQEPMIRACTAEDFDAILAIVNDAAGAYRGAIPADRWSEPYMPASLLRHEIDQGVRFWGYEEGGTLLGVMGVQQVDDVTLIRHAYVRTARRNQGIGGKLLNHLCGQAGRPILIGTWAAAIWAIRFYQKHGFRLVSREEKDRLLRRYWSVPERQIETSVVLADPAWLQAHPQAGGIGKEPLQRSSSGNPQV